MDRTKSHPTPHALSRRRLFGLVPLPWLAALAGRAPATGRPVPYDLLHGSLYVRGARGGNYATAITRFWRPGDAARCRLCATCTARHDVCTVLIGSAVPRAEAGAFSTEGGAA